LRSDLISTQFARRGRNRREAKERGEGKISRKIPAGSSDTNFVGYQRS